VKVVEYDPSRRGELADLTERVWGERADEAELDWFYGGNPVAPASVLLAEDDGRVVGAVAMSFLRMSVDGEEVKAGMPVHLATDPAYQGRGIFGDLEAANEERARGEASVRVADSGFGVRAAPSARLDAAAVASPVGAPPPAPRPHRSADTSRRPVRRASPQRRR
jgi:GNAT superfamily N-acetyltransferase